MFCTTLFANDPCNPPPPPTIITTTNITTNAIVVTYSLSNSWNPTTNIVSVGQKITYNGSFILNYPSIIKETITIKTNGAIKLEYPGENIIVAPVAEIYAWLFQINNTTGRQNTFSANFIPNSNFSNLLVNLKVQMNHTFYLNVPANLTNYNTTISNVYQVK